MQETLARTLTQEVGKPIRQSRNELKGLLPRIDFFLAESAKVLREEKVFADEGRSCANASRTSRWGSSPTSPRGTTPTSSAATCSSRR